MTPPQNGPLSIRLSRSGLLAELTADDLTSSGVVLSVGGAEQSHVETEDPSYLLHDYLRRMEAVLTALYGSDEGYSEGEHGGGERADHHGGGGPADALHLGAGALTLPRWMADRWPSVEQTVVDYEPELVDFVLRHLPMSRPPLNVVADAAEVLTDQLAGRMFDVVVVDLFNSAEAPETLTSPAFFSGVMRAVRPGGVLLMNFGDDAPMRFARALLRTVTLSVDPSAESLLLSAPDDVLSAQQEGNLVVAASRDRAITARSVERIWAAGPHPGEVLTGAELLGWAQDPDDDDVESRTH